MVNRGKLRKATSSASQCVGGKAAFTLTSKLAILVFSIEELAQSRGQGLRKAKKGDVRPVLNSTKIEVLKGKGLNLFFSICWCCFMKFFIKKKYIHVFIIFIIIILIYFNVELRPFLHVKFCSQNMWTPGVWRMEKGNWMKSISMTQ